MSSVSVACDVAALARPFDYAVPDQFSGPLEPGTMVRVSLHGRRVDGWILGPGEGAAVALQPLLKIKGLGPTTELLELSTWAAWRFAGPRTRFLKAASPERNCASLPTPPSWSCSPERDLGLRLPDPTAPVQLVTTGAVEDHFPLLLDALATWRPTATSGSVLITVPNQAYAERLAHRLRQHGVPASGPGPLAWVQARAGWPVVIGTRSAAFAPVPHLAGVVILDAHDDAYVEQASPTWNAIDVLIERATRADVPLALITPLPTPRLRALAAPQAAVGSRGSASWPTCTVVDKTTTDPRHGMLTEGFVDAARAALARSTSPGAVVVLHNAKGRATLLACRTCSALATCATCGATVAERGDVLVCAACHAERPVLCSACGAVGLKILRPGVARLAEEIAALLQCPVQEMTAASLDPVTTPVVVGTETVLHRIRRAQLVVVLDLDHYLLMARLDAEEHTLQVLVRSGRLVGARDGAGSGELLVQTRRPAHELVVGLVQGSIDDVLDHASERAARLGLPPFQAIAVLRGVDRVLAAAQVAAAASAISVVDLGDDSVMVTAPQMEVLCDGLAAIDRAKCAVTVAVGPGKVDRTGR